MVAFPVTTGSQPLAHYWRDSGPAFNWSSPTYFGENLNGPPSLIQSDFTSAPGAPGNFLVVAPSGSPYPDNIAYYSRNNAASNTPWDIIATIGLGEPTISYSAVALIESNFAGQLYVAAILQVPSDSLNIFSTNSAGASEQRYPGQLQAVGVRAEQLCPNCDHFAAPARQRTNAV